MSQTRAPVRSDARTRREALLIAATECFIADGYLVPLERIADRAGVGRGTLYRNFRDRADLALAIFDREVDGIGARMDLDLPFEEALVQFARDARSATALVFRLSGDLPMDGERRAAFEALSKRAETMIQPFVDQWHERGVLDPAMGSAEILAAVRMLSSLFPSETDVHLFESKLRTALAVILRGLTPRP